MDNTQVKALAEMVAVSLLGLLLLLDLAGGLPPQARRALVAAAAVLGVAFMGLVVTRFVTIAG